MSRSKRTGRKPTTDGGSGSTVPAPAVAVMEPTTNNDPTQAYAMLDGLDKGCDRLRVMLIVTRKGMDANLPAHAHLDVKRALAHLDTLRDQLNELEQVTAVLNRR